MSDYYAVNNSSYLEHHGILGQRWGIRRYQNADGSLTEAGRKKYGYNLDINDTSRKNVAKIRVGEARRRLDYAKIHNSSDVRKAELQGRLRSAKAVKATAKAYDQGARLAGKGETIQKTTNKAMLGLAGFAIGRRVVNRFLDTRLNVLKSEGRYTAGHQYVADMIKVGTFVALGTAATANSIHQANKANKIRTFYNQNRAGMGSIKRIGSDEYESRKKKANKEQRR